MINQTNKSCNPFIFHFNDSKNFHIGWIHIVEFYFLLIKKKCRQSSAEPENLIKLKTTEKTPFPACC